MLEIINIATPDLMTLTVVGSVQMLNGKASRVCAASASAAAA